MEVLELGVYYILDFINLEAIVSVEGKFDYIIFIVNLKFDWNLYISILVFQGYFYFVGVVLEFLDLNFFFFLMG